MADAHAVGDSNAPQVYLATMPNGTELHLFRRPNCSVRMIGTKEGALVEGLDGGYSSVSSALHEAESFVAKLVQAEKAEAAKEVLSPAQKAQITKAKNKAEKESTGRTSKV